MTESTQERPLAELASAIRRHPFHALGLGFLSGFLCGGGQRSTVGQGLVVFAARAAVRQTVAATLAEAFGNHERRVGN